MNDSVPWLSESASRACSIMCRYSPCTGTKYFGRTSVWTIFSSSCAACPRTCTSAMRLYSTFAPSLNRLSTVRCTSASFPGTADADRITVSPSTIFTCGWSWFAMRVSAEVGSPWLPV
jgi:hypothetical protein